MFRKKNDDLAIVFSALQLLAIKEILTSPSFKAKNSEELQWLIRCIDKAVDLESISRHLFGDVAQQVAEYRERYGKAS